MLVSTPNSPPLSRRTVLGATLGIGILSMGVGCGPIGPAASRLLTTAWFAAFSAQIGATAVIDLNKKGVGETVEEWSTGFDEVRRRIWPEWDGCRYDEALLSTTGPAFMTVRIPWYPVAGQCGNGESAILREGCTIVIEKGRDGLHFPSWAWQSLMLFADDATRGLGATEARRVESLMQDAMAPTSSDSEVGMSWAGAVEYISYQSARGPVDIALFETSDRKPKGHVKLAGFPDGDGRPTVRSFDLPTSA